MYLILCWSFITICWGKNLDKIKKNRLLNRNRNIWGEKIAIRLFSQIVQPYCKCERSLVRYSTNERTISTEGRQSVHFKAVLSKEYYTQQCVCVCVCVC